MSPVRKPSQPKSFSIDWPSLLGNDCLGLDSIELDQLSAQLFAHSTRCVRAAASQSTVKLPFDVSPVPWHDRGFWLQDPQIRPGAYLQFAAGEYYVQDASSLLALTLCRLLPGQTVCDLCAAPGGKASGLLDQLAGTGFLLANEVIQSRLALLQLTLDRTGWSNHAVSSLDAQRLADHLPEQFDCVLVDAPCSGQSMVGREKQTSAAFGSAQVEYCAARQQRIIAAAAQLVRPGGRLVYSTCTFSTAENEMIIEQFLQQHTEWKVDPLPALEQWASPRLPGTYRLWPHRNNCDGGFAAALIRCIPDSTREYPPIRLEAQSRRWQVWPGQLADLVFLETACSASQKQMAWQLNDTVHLFCHSPWPQLAKLCHSGIEMAEIRSRRIEPAYASAVVRFDSMRPRSRIELTTQQAIQFVRGESFAIKATNLIDSPSHGWAQVCWQERPLSWGKHADGKLKNHFPKLLRNHGITRD